MPRDRFYDYLDYCDTHDPVSPGDYIESVMKDRTTLAWTRLVNDLRDTWKAGKLKRVQTSNGGAAYVRPAQARMPSVPLQPPDRNRQRYPAGLGVSG